MTVYLVLRSRRPGLQAVRDAEGGARGLGVDVTDRYVVFLVAGFLTGVAGAVYTLKFGWVTPDAAFSVSAWTAPIIVMVVIGGLGTVEGPIIGAVMYFVLEKQLAGGGDASRSAPRRSGS